MAKINNEDTITSELIKEIKEALTSVKYGSIEIFIQNKVVTQITVRNIRKTSVGINNENRDSENLTSEKIRKPITNIAQTRS